MLMQKVPDHSPIRRRKRARRLCVQLSTQLPTMCVVFVDITAAFRLKDQNSALVIAEEPLTPTAHRLNAAAAFHRFSSKRFLIVSNAPARRSRVPTLLAIPLFRRSRRSFLKSNSVTNGCAE